MNKKSELQTTKDTYSSTESFLKFKNIQYRTIKVDPTLSAWEVSRDKNIPYEKILRSHIVKSIGNIFLVTVSIDKIIDPRLLVSTLGVRKLFVGNEDDKNFYEEGVDSYVPIPELCKATGILDSSLDLKDDVYFFSEEPGVLLVIKSKDFFMLHDGSKRLDFSYPLSKLKLYQEPLGFKDINVIKGKFSVVRMKSRIMEVFEIPANSIIVGKIAKLKSKKKIDAKELLQLVASDPSITAQIMRWACSPYYKNKGKVNSLEDAVIKVLSPDLAINIAIGLSIGKSLQIPTKGIIGLQQYWEHSLYISSLVTELLEVIPEDKQIKKGLVKVASILHDFGFLVLGQVFSPQFEVLSQAIELNRDVGVVKLENYLFQVNHQQLSSWILKNWHLPEEVITAIKYHHHDDYFGKNSIYSNILFLADNLLKKTDLSCGRRSRKIYPEIYEQIGITEKQANLALQNVLKNKAEFKKMSSELFHEENILESNNSFNKNNKIL